MAFGKQENVAPGPVGFLGVDAHDAKVEDGQQIDRGLRPLFNDLAHGFLRVEHRLLGEIIDGETFREDGFAVKFLVDAGEDAQQRTLARAVEPQHPDLGPVKIGQGDIFQDLLLTIFFADFDHRIDDLVRFNGHAVFHPLN